VNKSELKHRHSIDSITHEYLSKEGIRVKKRKEKCDDSLIFERIIAFFY